MKNRCRYEIIASILSAIRDRNSKTKIMFISHISYMQLVQYLDFLHDNKLIKKNRSGTGYMITEKGSDYLEKYKIMQSFVVNTTSLSSYGSTQN